MACNNPLRAWRNECVEWFFHRPDGTYADFKLAFPDDTHTYKQWQQKRSTTLPPGRPMSQRGDGMLYRKEGTPDGMPSVFHDKREIDFHWSDVIEPLSDLQHIAKNASGSQDRGHIYVKTKKRVPLLFISDWHIGSWGTSYLRVAEITETIKKHGLYVAVLGDMLQMSIKLRGVLEVSDNAIPPRLQDRFWESWLEDMYPWVLWGTWDNHTVMRQEDATGFSAYAEMFRNKTIYHSGIGHIDMQVGKQTYKIATSHRFRGNSYMNPTHGQMRYGRMEGLDREIIVAGDSHTPAVTTYADGEMPRVAINCGTLQTDSGYAKRFYSLSTHDWMPVVEFMPDQHLFMAYPSLTHWLTFQQGGKT